MLDTYITDHFTCMKHGDMRISKGPPLQWLAHFLAQYNLHCEGKYVYLDQGGELFNHLEVRNLFRKKGYDILPTGADKPQLVVATTSTSTSITSSHRILLLAVAI